MRATYLLPVVFLAGCGALTVREQNQNRIHDLETRASFDLNCPRSDLVITNLTAHELRCRTHPLAGVDGCGQRATYVWNWHQFAWVLNNTSMEGRSVGAGR